MNYMGLEWAGLDWEGQVFDIKLNSLGSRPQAVCYVFYKRLLERVSWIRKAKVGGAGVTT